MASANSDAPVLLDRDQVALRSALPIVMVARSTLRASARDRPPCTACTIELRGVCTSLYLSGLPGGMLALAPTPLSIT